MEDFDDTTVSPFNAVIGEDVGTQAWCDVSDAETQIYRMTNHVAVQHSPDHDHQSTQTEFDAFSREHLGTQTDFSTIHHRHDHQSTQMLV